MRTILFLAALLYTLPTLPASALEVCPRGGHLGGWTKNCIPNIIDEGRTNKAYRFNCYDGTELVFYKVGPKGPSQAQTNSSNDDKMAIESDGYRYLCLHPEEVGPGETIDRRHGRYVE